MHNFQINNNSDDLQEDDDDGGSGRRCHWCVCVDKV